MGSLNILQANLAVWSPLGHLCTEQVPPHSEEKVGLVTSKGCSEGRISGTQCGKLREAHAMEKCQKPLVCRGAGPKGCMWTLTVGFTLKTILTLERPNQHPKDFAR